MYRRDTVRDCVRFLSCLEMYCAEVRGFEVWRVMMQQGVVWCCVFVVFLGVVQARRDLALRGFLMLENT